MRQTRALAKKPRKRSNDLEEEAEMAADPVRPSGPLQRLLDAHHSTPRRLWTSVTGFGRGRGQVGRTVASLRLVPCPAWALADDGNLEDAQGRA